MTNIELDHAALDEFLQDFEHLSIEIKHPDSEERRKSYDQQSTAAQGLQMVESAPQPSPSGQGGHMVTRPANPSQAEDPSPQLLNTPEILKLSPDELKRRGLSDEIIQKVMVYRQHLIANPWPSGPPVPPLPATIDPFPGLNIPQEQLVEAQNKVRAAIGLFHNKCNNPSVNLSHEQGILLEQSLQQTQSLLKQVAQNLVSFVFLAPDDGRELNQVAQTIVALSDQAKIFQKPPPEKRFIFTLVDLNQYRNHLTTFLMRVRDLQTQAMALQNQQNSGVPPPGPPAVLSRPSHPTPSDLGGVPPLALGTTGALQPSGLPSQPRGAQFQGTVPLLPGLNVPQEQLVEAQNKVRAAIGLFHNKRDYYSINLSHEQGILLEQSVQQTQSLLKQVAQNLVSFVVLAPDDEHELAQIAQTIVTLSDQTQILQKPPPEKRFIFGLGDLNQYRSHLTMFLMRVKGLQSQALALQNQQNSGLPPPGPRPPLIPS